MENSGEHEPDLHLSESVGLPVTLGTPWEFSWADQPTHDPDGYLYTYYVVEIKSTCELHAG